MRRLAFDNLLMEVTVKNGDCQFHALELQLSRMDPENRMNAKKIRTLVVDWLSDNGAVLIENGERLDSYSSAGSWMQYVEGIRDGGWGDHITLLAASVVLLRRIKIYSSLPSVSTPIWCQIPDTMDLPHMGQELVLAHLHEWHWMSTKPVCGASGDQKRGEKRTMHVNDECVSPSGVLQMTGMLESEMKEAQVDEEGECRVCPKKLEERNVQALGIPQGYGAEDTSQQTWKEVEAPKIEADTPQTAMEAQYHLRASEEKRGFLPRGNLEEETEGVKELVLRLKGGNVSIPKSVLPRVDYMLQIPCEGGLHQPNSIKTISVEDITPLREDREKEVFVLIDYTLMKLKGCLQHLNKSIIKILTSGDMMHVTLVIAKRTVNVPLHPIAVLRRDMSTTTRLLKGCIKKVTLHLDVILEDGTRSAIIITQVSGRKSDEIPVLTSVHNGLFVPSLKDTDDRSYVECTLVVKHGLHGNPVDAMRDRFEVLVKDKVASSTMIPVHSELFDDFDYFSAIMSVKKIDEERVLEEAKKARLSRGSAVWAMPVRLNTDELGQYYHLILQGSEMERCDGIVMGKQNDGHAPKPEGTPRFLEPRAARGILSLSEFLDTDTSSPGTTVGFFPNSATSLYVVMLKEAADAFISKLTYQHAREAFSILGNTNDPAQRPSLLVARLHRGMRRESTEPTRTGKRVQEIVS